MEEDVGAKAPVTRLRRRLSVEQSEEVKSPSAPSTPSKKRGGRLAAKPQLELIDENSSENTTRKQTKKTAAKDVIEASEDKVLTPSRRSTRIKSNTSIISDTPQSFDSPRAKRAARRNSQIGSDNEAPVTPARQTRRTRKDSTTSVDKQDTVTSAEKNATTIVEEVETESKNSSDVKQSEKSEITPIRKSPRLQKKDKLSDATENDGSLKENNVASNTNKRNDKKISDDSFQLINNLNEQPVYKLQLNNSTSAVNSKKATINKTKTWSSTENLSGVNNDINKQNKIEEKENYQVNVKKSESNNNLEADSGTMKNDENGNKNISAVNNNVSVDNKTLNNSLHEKSNTELSLSNKTNIENADLNETQKLLQNAPVAAVQSFIYYDDSDSDKGKPIVSDKPIESEDQCVPVVPEINQKSIFNQSDKVSYNDTCEPMDIDETIPNNVSLINSSESKQEKDLLEKSLEQKLIPTENISQNMEKTSNESKSTLILSQLKDISTTDHNLTKSPKTAVDFLSVNDINKDKYTDKKDDYMTSTPLQQKNLKKMAMQINTSLINNSNNGSKNTSLVEKYNKKKYSKQSNKSCTDSSSEESESEQESKEKRVFLDDEAEEASDDYESGDSQNEEERQYEKDNEIVEKGETLDSSDNSSNDTDYEKDSFVVSSDEEDNDLLSGSGDNLSMSDNELTQSKKSKKKFDDRKLKEQKKASREMFEARHNISNNSTKSDVTKRKKNRRQRLNSSTLVSEEENRIVGKSKKNIRLKLDSSDDSSTEDVVSKGKVAENNVSMTVEQEITSVCNESVINREDPLLTKMKSEPQTPLKDMNISAVPIHDEIEEIHLDQNISVMKTNETSDPLQEEESDASSIGENMEITSNYDSLLKELNNVKDNKKIKSLDISLNFNTKTKQSPKPAIVDNLNLTNTKKSNKTSKSNAIAKPTNPENKTAFDESSSDSIDLQLLFSEDSCDSVKKDQSKTKQETDSFIPLKRTEAKTNILEDNNKEDNTREKKDTSAITNQSNSDALNISLKKKKKKKNSISVSDEVTNEKSNISLKTTNHEVSLLDTSSKKKKISIDSTNQLNDQTNSSHLYEKLNVSQIEPNQNISMDTSLNTSKKKQKNNLSRSDESNQNIEGETVPQETVLNTSSKKKKQRKSSGNETENVVLNVSQNGINENISINSTVDTSSKKKKKKHKLSVNEETDTMKNYDQDDLNMSLHKNNQDNSMNSSTLNTSSKKKKNSISFNEDTDKNIDIISSTLNNSLKKKKKNSVSSVGDQFDFGNKFTDVMNVENNTTMFTNSNEVLTESSKKKKKHNSSVVADLNIDDSSNPSAKKKKKAKAADVKTTDNVSRDEDSDAAPEEIPYTSHKNSASADLSGGIHMFVDTDSNQDRNTLNTSGSSKKKDKKKKNIQAPETSDYTIPENNSEETSTSKKRKRKLSANSQETISVDPDSNNETLNMETKRKKQKISQSEDSPAEIKDIIKKKKNKKRKERDDDDENKSAKVFKQNSTDKINVPRLSSTIINQLEDKPRKEVLEMKKAKVVSTSQFIIEEANRRKNKPSNYLEESVYLNDSVEELRKGSIKKIPKVLPFVPTATISGSGFTTKFQVNVLQKETKFVAQTSNLTGFKNEYLVGKKIKKVGTYELYKSQRNRKLSKF